MSQETRTLGEALQSVVSMPLHSVDFVEDYVQLR